MVTTPLVDKVNQGGTLDTDDLALLKALTEMNAAPEPQPEDTVIRAGDAAKDIAPMVRTKATSAGYVFLRRNSDGKLVSINKNQLLERLKQKLDDGRPAWLSPTVPHPGPFIGTEKCLLHPEHPDYLATYKAMGLMSCGAKSAQPPKANMANKEAVFLHMEKKHKASWQMIQRMEQRIREDRRDTAQIQMAEALSVALKPAAPVSATKVPAKAFTRVCEVCQEVFSAGAAVAAMNKLRRHTKQVHPG